ncbi:Deoxyguanosinetriphosphate triphosphohydrolase [termite gut metagenome]|uniref:Deoxyguanosinetriphosphate triphosphohydrolase n=1 Tax=termite gut metagenome TaxID=433724 RepID=A0A5J4R1C9_9ZZZZ
MSDYTKFFTEKRIRSSSVDTQRVLLEESYSDRSRIVFSSAFRRLQQKAQVFSLEKNTYVRSRMTHSIEVSDYGKGIATKVGRQLVNSGHLDKDELLIFINVVENACFLHDIGNPPFGHFGEAAIKKWFEDNWKTVYNKSTEKKQEMNVFLKSTFMIFLSLMEIHKDFG